MASAEDTMPERYQLLVGAMLRLGLPRPKHPASASA
jgi:hypothetical protein